MLSEPKLDEQLIEELLGRKPFDLDYEAVTRMLAGKRILVTGGAGSIGSEICRQALQFQPELIVAMDCAESALFHLAQEMEERFPQAPFAAELASTRNPQRLEEIMRRIRPSIVYHAAAFKHVTMAERFPFEAVENNVFGTVDVLEAARSGVEIFVLLSTDKAVKPAGVMGVTKRVAELLLLAHPAPPRRSFSIRFGNVLGSGGSALPRFLEQIRAGVPVTVTHPEMQRFFMTQSEAARLCLQTLCLTETDLFLFNMGRPIRIVDLVRQLTHGEIHFTGFRPGEKLSEELIAVGEEVQNTSHPNILAVIPRESSREHTLQHVEELREHCRARNLKKLLQALIDLVPDYTPSPEILSRAG